MHIEEQAEPGMTAALTKDPFFVFGVDSRQAKAIKPDNCLYAAAAVMVENIPPDIMERINNAKPDETIVLAVSIAKTPPPQKRIQ